MQPGIPTSRPSDIKDIQESNLPTLEKLRSEFDSLKKDLVRHLKGLDEKVVRIGRAEHTIFSETNFMGILDNLKKAESEKQRVEFTRRKFLGAGAAAGVVMAGVSTILGKALLQFEEELAARREGRDSIEVDLSAYQVLLGALVGTVVWHLVYESLKRNSDLDKKESRANNVIDDALLERKRLIKYYVNLFSDQRITSLDDTAGVFVDEFLDIVNRMANVNRQINELESKNSK